MKYIALFLFSICCFPFSAQEILKIEYVLETKLDENYEVKIFNADGKLEKNSIFSEQLKAQMQEPKYYELLIKGNESLFKNKPKINNSQETGRIIFMSHNEEIKYLNTETAITKRNTEEMNQTYLVIDTLDKPDWQIFREKNKILNYDVRKATWRKDSTQFYTAWFAPKLSFKTGPQLFWGLPGLILQIEEIETHEGYNNKYIYSVHNIAFAEENEFNIPHEGKVVSEEEMGEIYAKAWEHFKEMQGEGVDTDD